MKKILLIANTDWYLFRFRISLARYLKDRGYEVVFVSPSGQYVTQLEEEGFRWLGWEVGRQSTNPIKEGASIIKLLRIIKKEAPDLIHLHTIKPVLYGSLCGWLLKNISIVRSITGRGYIFLGRDIRARVLKPFVKASYSFLLNAGRGTVVFENTADRDFFLEQRLVDSENAVVIEGVGVDTDHYLPTPEPDGIPFILLAGRMLWDKGVGTFVETARLLRSRLPAKFLLVGQQDQGNPANIPTKLLEGWSREGVVEWQGWVSDMRRVFAICHIVTLPSLGEGLPTILLEAAASGRPIVATDVPGCRDVVQNGINGYLVPSEDPESLARAIEVLIKDPVLRKTMGASGREMVMKRFSSSIVNSSTLTIYRGLIESH